MILLNAQLEAFLAVVNLRTISAAGVSLGITQTAMTQRIRLLEERLGATLFIRSRKGMSLTKQGEALLHSCKAILEQEGQLVAHLEGSARTREILVTISAPSTATEMRLIPNYISLRKDYPRLVAAFDIDDTEEPIHKLRQGKCDIAVVSPSVVSKEMDSKLLKPECYILIGPTHWASRPLKEILENEPIIDFNETDQMTFNFLEKYDLIKAARTTRIFANHPDLITNLVSQGMGYTVLTKERVQRWIEEKKLVCLAPGKIFENPIALAWYPRPQMPPYLGRFIRMIK